MPTLSVRLSEEEARIVKAYASQERRSMSDVARLALLDAIEAEYELELYNKAMEEYRKNPVTYNHEEMMKKYA